MKSVYFGISSIDKRPIVRRELLDNGGRRWHWLNLVEGVDRGVGDSHADLAICINRGTLTRNMSGLAAFVANFPNRVQGPSIGSGAVA